MICVQYRYRLRKFGTQRLFSYQRNLYLRYYLTLFLQVHQTNESPIQKEAQGTLKLFLKDYLTIIFKNTYLKKVHTFRN